MSVVNGKVSLNGVTATVAEDTILENDKKYVLKVALKKNTEELEELFVLDNLLPDQETVYAGGTLSLTLNGEYQLPEHVSEGEYDLVAYVATADTGIRVSKFQRVLCVGEVDDTVPLNGMTLHTTITAEKVLQSVYTNTFDVDFVLKQEGTPYRYEEVLASVEDVIMLNGYFAVDAQLEAYDVDTQTGTPVDGEELSAGLYRIPYLAQADGGEITAYIYCRIVLN